MKNERIRKVRRGGNSWVFSARARRHASRARLAAGGRPAIVVDPEPRFELSPYLYMQFMEPLGTTDGSVAAAWDFGRTAGART